MMCSPAAGSYYALNRSLLMFIIPHPDYRLNGADRDQQTLTTQMNNSASIDFSESTSLQQ
jgi:hypothetical protein